jgi:hypothetical protein
MGGAASCQSPTAPLNNAATTVDAIAILNQRAKSLMRRIHRFTCHVSLIFYPPQPCSALPTAVTARYGDGAVPSPSNAMRR